MTSGANGSSEVEGTAGTGSGVNGSDAAGRARGDDGLARFNDRDSALKPPICCVCGRRDDPACALVSFADHQDVPSGMVGHPVGAEWFCSEHVQSAEALTDLPSSDAIARIRTEGMPGAALRKERRRSPLYLTAGAGAVVALLVFLAFARRYDLVRCTDPGSAGAALTGGRRGTK